MPNSLYTTKGVCLYCDTKFETKRVRTSKIIKADQDTDFCIYFKGENPFFYEIFVCPNCGFAFSKSFKQKLTDEQKEAFALLAKKWYPRHKYSFARDLGAAIEAYKLGFVTAQTIEENDLILAGIALRIAWFYRYSDNEQEEQRFLNVAKDLYDKAFRGGNLNGHEQPEINIIYIIGELNARTGDYHSAIRWFSKVTEHRQKIFYTDPW